MTHLGARRVGTSIAFLSAAQDALLGKPAVNGFKSQWVIRLARLLDGRALVDAGVPIEVGYEVYFSGHELFLPGSDGTGFLRTPEIVAEVDRTTRASTHEWVIRFEGASPEGPSGTPTVQAELEPERFAQPLLRWIYETSGASRVPVDLSAFAQGEVPLNSVVALAQHLAVDGLITLEPGAATATVTMTEDGFAAASEASAARTNPVRRAEALRRGMITWLAERENASLRTNGWEAFLWDSRSSCFGDFFTVDELVREAAYLAEHGLIRGLGGGKGNGTDFGWIVPQLTAKGRDCNDYCGGDVTESLKPEKPASSPHISADNSPGAQINIGDNGSQRMTHGDNSTQQINTGNNSSQQLNTASQPEEASRTWWRKAWDFINSLAGIVIAVGTVVLVYLTYLLVHQH